VGHGTRSSLIAMRALVTVNVATCFRYDSIGREVSTSEIRLSVTSDGVLHRSRGLEIASNCDESHGALKCQLRSVFNSFHQHFYIRTYSFITNCETVHKNRTKHRAKIYNSQCLLWYNIVTVELHSVIREMRSGSCLL